MVLRDRLDGVVYQSRGLVRPLLAAAASGEEPLSGLSRWANRSQVSGARQRRLLSAIWREMALSRRALHDETGIRPNTITLDVSTLLECGILMEIPSPASGRGRPSVPLKINPEERDVLGLAIESGCVGIARLNLLGHVLESRQETNSRDSHAMIRSVEKMLEGFLRESTIGVGFSATGSVDPVNRFCLRGSAWSHSHEVNLQSIYDLAGHRSLVLENDMHALGARWVLQRRISDTEDTLLVSFADGQLGASLLVNGRPNRGCITAANELGHTRLPVETERCLCGGVGCLERICSTSFLSRQPGSHQGSLTQRAATYDGRDAGMKRVIDLLGLGIANAVTFSRVHRLVLVSELTRYPEFTKALIDSIRKQTLGEIEPHVTFEVWQQAAGQPAETAGYLALANLYLDGWGEVTDLGNLVHQSKLAQAT